MRWWVDVSHRIEGEAPDSHSARLQRVRERLRGSQIDRRVRSAQQFYFVWAAAEGDRHWYKHAIKLRESQSQGSRWQAERL